MTDQQIEIEFKNMLTQEEYKLLINAFHISEHQLVEQENFYFDTRQFSLKKRNSALRVRKKEGKYELTLKEPLQVGLLETNQTITEKDMTMLMENISFPDGKIKETIERWNLSPKQIMFFGSLKTIRAEITYKGGILVFDHNYYLNKEDFELEYEVENYHEGKKIFESLLNEFNIPLRRADNKIVRFYREKIKCIEG